MPPPVRPLFQFPSPTVIVEVMMIEGFATSTLDLELARFLGPPAPVCKIGMLPTAVQTEALDRLRPGGLSNLPITAAGTAPTEATAI